MLDDAFGRRSSRRLGQALRQTRGPRGQHRTSGERGRQPGCRTVRGCADLTVAPVARCADLDGTPTAAGKPVPANASAPPPRGPPAGRAAAPLVVFDQSDYALTTLHPVIGLGRTSGIAAAVCLTGALVTAALLPESGVAASRSSPSPGRDFLLPHGGGQRPGRRYVGGNRRGGLRKLIVGSSVRPLLGGLAGIALGGFMELGACRGGNGIPAQEVRAGPVAWFVARTVAGRCRWSR